jgi:DNA-nicking Smr family endonuclease
MVNKYQQNAEAEIDLHGYTTIESKEILDDLISERKYKHIRIIVGKGNNSANGPILPSFVKNYLDSRDIRYSQSKIQHGGEGALDVFFKLT